MPLQMESRGFMHRLSGGMILMLAAALAGAQTSPDDDAKPPSADALRAEIESLRDTNVLWRKVVWRTCLLEAFKESAREKKPVFLWVLGGAPANGRC